MLSWVGLGTYSNTLQLAVTGQLNVEGERT